MKITAEVGLIVNVELEIPDPNSMSTEEMEDQLFKTARKDIDVNTAEAMIISYKLDDSNKISSKN